MFGLLELFVVEDGADMRCLPLRSNCLPRIPGLNACFGENGYVGLEVTWSDDFATA